MIEDLRGFIRIRRRAEGDSPEVLDENLEWREDRYFFIAHFNHRKFLLLNNEDRSVMNMLFAERTYSSILKRFWGLVVFLSLLFIINHFFIFPYWFWFGQGCNIPEPSPRDGKKISLEASTADSSRIGVEGFEFVNVCQIPELQKWLERHDMAAFYPSKKVCVHL